jgi:tetratricopeptide (TPR) repeat protein
VIDSQAPIWGAAEGVLSVGDNDFDIADMIAEEVGHDLPKEPVQAATLSDHPQAGQLHSIAGRIQGATTAFEVLGHTRDAEQSVLRGAYTDLAKQLHPDRFTAASEDLIDQASALFDKVREAYEQLETDEKRQKYCDHVLDGKPTEDEEAMETVRVYLSAESDFKRGLAAFNAGRISQAHKLFQGAAEAVPDEIEFEVYLAYTTFNLNRQRDPERANAAMDKLKDALEANQNQERRLDGGWVLMGRAYREQGNNEGAKRCLVQALRFNPANPDAARELRRLTGGGGGGPAKKKGFFGKLFGGKNK